MRSLSLSQHTIAPQVDARLSFDVEGTITKARKIIALYKEKVRARPTRARDPLALHSSTLALSPLLLV